MFGLNRLNPFDDIFNFQRELDRVFNQFWSDLPARTAGMSQSFQVDSNQDEWRIDVPLPGVDPSHVNLEVAGNTVSIRVSEPNEKGDSRDTAPRYEQTLTVPQFLDLDKISASHKHGMLRLTLPVKESVKPRRVEIATSGEGAKQLTAA
jgi:HSP20 family protein